MPRKQGDEVCALDGSNGPARRRRWLVPRRAWLITRRRPACGSMESVLTWLRETGCAFLEHARRRVRQEGTSLRWQV